ncbi:oxidoreductase [Streptomyces phaeolivaceus]|uniref:Oxidoreductase n=2 Tax=Streptomyces phaeolivaceus TaxID=2653200 RepID=A0A5P8KJ00_9ACTN|nr:oxidoreductase [Streptomyces phaeolivaceus]
MEVEIPVVVARRRRVTADIVRLWLIGVDARPLPSWTPGAHIDVLLPNGTERQYSLCGDPSDEEWSIMVLREPQGRGGSQYVHDAVWTGQKLKVRGPRNHFALDPAPRYRFLAGGIGITPILPMLREAEAAGAEWSLTYCGRSRQGMACAEELTVGHGGRVRLHVDSEQGVPDVAALLSDPRPGELLYACGPNSMLEAIERMGAHWPKGSIHFERFSAVTRDTTADTEFEVELASSGKVLTVPADRSILDVVRESGIQMLSSCQEGTCGTCETAVVSGQVDHRDAVLSKEEQEENEVMMVCVSRAACPRLVLDL